MFPEKYNNFEIKYFLNGSYIEIEHSDLASKLQYQNYMHFILSAPKSKADQPSDTALLMSFDTKLKSTGVLEKRRLLRYIQMVARLDTNTGDYFLAPIVNVCQSSGSGKSKLAAEIMFDTPSCYLVLRENTSAKGFPSSTYISKLLYNMILIDRDDDDITSSAGQCNVGRYMLFLKCLIKDYYDRLKIICDANGYFKLNGSQKNLKKECFKKVLKVLADEILKGTFKGEELKNFETGHSLGNFLIDSNSGGLVKKQNLSNDDLNSIKMSDIKTAFINTVDAIKKLNPEDSNFPFVLTLDEASLLAQKKSPKNTSCFRLFRRAVNRLSGNDSFVVVTLGTNPDLMDLSPEIANDSFRESFAGKLFPPFILSRNWDIHFDPQQLVESPINYNKLLCGRMLTYLLSLGRPLWSSITFSRLIDFMEVKVCNNSLDSGEAYLAFWMIRVGLSINPAHIINRFLVRSLMATLLYVSADIKQMRICYPSEPALAIAARSILHKNEKEDEQIIKYYEELEKYIKARVIDVGRFSEIISADICLLALGKAKCEACNWDLVQDLPKVCQRTHFIFENSEFHSEETKNLAESTSHRSPSISDDFKKNYRVVLVNEFIKSKYGENVFLAIESFIPELMKSALMNMTHYVQLSSTFPFSDDLFKDYKFEWTETPVADEQYQYIKHKKGCKQITTEVLENGIIRGFGLMFEPNTFGLDHGIPVCFKPMPLEGAEAVEGVEKLQISAEIEMGNAESESDWEGDVISEVTSKYSTAPVTAPEYSFIGVQVKRGTLAESRNIVAKCAVSNHFVRCGKHKSCEESCEFRVSDEEYKKILENGFAMIHFMDGRIEVDKKLAQDTSQGPEQQSTGRGRKRSYSNMPTINPKNSVIDSIICECKDPEALNLFNELKNDEVSDQDKIEIKTKLKSMISDLCPPEYLKHFDKFKFKMFSLSHYNDSRFCPDLYLSFRVSRKIQIICMMKQRSDGIKERITAIVSEGFGVFSNVLPARAREVARRIIFDDSSVFDEVKSGTIKFSELVTSVVSRNSHQIPATSNFIRTKYKVPAIPDKIPDYKNVDKKNIFEKV